MDDMKNSNSRVPSLFDFGREKKLVLILCAGVLWFIALIVYSIPNFNHWFLLIFNTLRADPLIATICYYYTIYMLYAIVTPITILYIASFKINKLKPYRTVLFLTFITLAIGIPIVDLFKYTYGVPRPWVLYPDITHLYFVRGSSFPSGHAFQAFAGTLPLIICFLTNDKIFKRTRTKTILAAILLLFAITLSFSRILAGVHFPSDVLFAIGLAIILMVIVAIILQWLIKTQKLNLRNEIWFALPFIILIVIDLLYL